MTTLEQPLDGKKNPTDRYLSTNRTVTKDGVWRIGNDEISFCYYVTRDLLSRSPLFSLKLRKIIDQRGIIGVLFDDMKLVWSIEVPRHVALIDVEGRSDNQVVARIQTQPVLYSTWPEIQLLVRDHEVAKKLGTFVSKCAMPDQIMSVSVVDDLIDYKGSSKIVFRGLIADWNLK